MRGKLIICRGLPASGKTTFAKDFCAESPGVRVRVNRDDLRFALNGATYGYSPATELVVTIAQQTVVRELLLAGKTVVVDDQNLAMRYSRAWSKVAYECGAEFDVFDWFLKVPLETCIERDQLRDPLLRVGKDFIRKQWQRYNLGGKGLPEVPPYMPPAGSEVEPYVGNPGLPNVIIVDVDGTLALNAGGRNYYDYSRVAEDTPNTPVVDLVYHESHQCGPGNDVQVIVVSGRDDSCYDETARWLNRDAALEYDELYMRRTGDKRQDTEIKLEIFNTHIRGRFNVLYVLDDRDAVVAMWRQLGLTCLQVAPGNF